MVGLARRTFLMSPNAANRQESFIARAMRVCRENVAGAFGRANQWRRRSVEWVDWNLTMLAEWQTGHKVGVVVGLGLVIWAGLSLWFIVDWSRGRVQGSAVQIGIGALIGGAVFGLLASAVAALVAFVAILLLNKIFQLLAPIVLFLPLIPWVPLYAAWQVVLVVGKLLLLVPLSVLFVSTRAVQIWRGIFYTCPSRDCGYRGLPIYVCAGCGHGNRRLWPNLYGLLWHRCVACDRRLPALDMLGRRKLGRRCGGCEMPLAGRHAGKARERLVAIVGGPGSGKTNYLLMTVNEILDGRGGARRSIAGEIDDPAQAEAFHHEWRKLEQGVPASKTSEVIRALLLYAKVGRSRCQLYLYDAPGEEFGTIGSMTKQQYFHLLDGFLLLVDPCGFEQVRSACGSQAAALPLQDVVTSVLVTASAGAPVVRGGKLKPRLAVVLSKADLAPVRTELGSINDESGASAERCRQAIVRWGGEHVLRAIEHRFESVEYFACSPLGRSADAERGTPFTGKGVLEPLEWVLTGTRAGAQHSPATEMPVAG